MEIKNLIEKNQKIFCHPLKCYYDFSQLSDNQTVTKVAVSVSKRHFKRAVDRNRIKRLLRECYRQKKHLLTPTFDNKKVVANLLIIYVGAEIPSYKTIDNKINSIFQRLIGINLTENEDHAE